jgi:2-iminobutanoate/2-iminopropanoate deaminase
MNQAGPNPHAFAQTWEYSQSIVTDGRLVFTAGHGGFGEDGEVVSDDFEAQLRQTYANLAKTLEAAGASLDSIVKTTVYLRHASDYETFQRVRHEMFAPPYPASTAVRCDLLFDEMLMEIDAVARVGETRSPAD